MNIKASLLYAQKLILPKSEKKSSARKSLWGALFCIGLSIIPLVVVVNVTDGMINGMTERLIGLSSGQLEVYVAQKYSKVQSEEKYIEYTEEIKKIAGVKNAFPEIRISALAAGKDYRTGAQIRAVNKNIFEENKDFANLIEFTEGSFESFGGKNAIIGQKIAQDLNLHEGDSFRIITTKESGSKVVPKLTTFTVCGIVTSGYQELDALWVFISLESAYKNLSLSNADYNILIKTEDSFSPQLSVIQQRVKKFCGKYANVYRWNQVHESEYENFSSTKVMLVFVMMLIVLVASVNVSSAIIMLVMERKKEIAILKSLGGSSRGITLSFLFAGTACGVGGVIIGLPFGILITLYFNEIISYIEKSINFFSSFFTDEKIVLLDPSYYLSKVPVSISASSIFLIIIGTILLSVVVSIIPSIKAGKEKPLEIIRKN